MIYFSDEVTKPFYQVSQLRDGRYVHLVGNNPTEEEFNRYEVILRNDYEEGIERLEVPQPERFEPGLERFERVEEIYAIDRSTKMATEWAIVAYHVAEDGTVINVAGADPSTYELAGEIAYYCEENGLDFDRLYWVNTLGYSADEAERQQEFDQKRNRARRAIVKAEGVDLEW